MKGRGYETHRLTELSEWAIGTHGTVDLLCLLETFTLLTLLVIVEIWVLCTGLVASRLIAMLTFDQSS